MGTWLVSRTATRRLAVPRQPWVTSRGYLRSHCEDLFLSDAGPVEGNCFHEVSLSRIHRFPVQASQPARRRSPSCRRLMQYLRTFPSLELTQLHLRPVVQ